MSQKRLTFHNLWVCVTRRCNLPHTCLHCMRGEPQSVDLSRECIDRLLEQTELIGKLVLTGGEPTAAVDTIEYIINQLMKKSIPLLQLQVITNGFAYSQHFAEVIKLFAEHIKWSVSEKVDIRERILFGVSTDHYHSSCYDPLPTFNTYKAQFQDIATVYEDKQGDTVLKLGKAKNIDGIPCNYQFSMPEKKITLFSKERVCNCPAAGTFSLLYDNQICVACPIVVTATGKLIPCGDRYKEWAAEDGTQEICYLDGSSIIQAIEKYNNNAARVSCIDYQLVYLDLVKSGKLDKDIFEYSQYMKKISSNKHSQTGLIPATSKCESETVDIYSDHASPRKLKELQKSLLEGKRTFRERALTCKSRRYYPNIPDDEWVEVCRNRELIL